MRNFLGLLILIFLSTTAACGEGMPSCKRIVVLNKDAAEILVALGVADRIVGITDKKADFFPSLLKDIPEVGRFDKPNIEAIVKLAPDIVIAYDRWPSKETLEDKLLPIGIKVLRISCYKINSLTRDIWILGRLVGREKRAKEYIDFIQKYIDLLSERTRGITQKVKVYQEYNDYCTVSEGSGGDEILKIAGVENIASGFKIPFPEVSAEWVFAKNPDLIIKVLYSGIEVSKDIFKELITRPGWSKLKAVKENKVHIISSEIWTGPKAIIGAFYLAKWSYPDIFSDINPEAIHRELVKNFYNEDLKKVYVYP